MLRTTAVRRSLALGLAAVLVLLTAGSTVAQTNGVVILSSSTYTSSTGSLWLVGEVQNTSGETVEFVKVIVSYRDRGGSLIATDFGYIEMDKLLPGETSPFDVLTLNPPAGIATHETIVEYRRARTEPLRGFEARVGNVRRTPATGSVRITGEVTNTTGVPAEFVKVIAALYDGSGTVIRVDFAYAERRTIEPGGRSPFEVLILNPPPYAEYRLWVDGRQAR